MKRYAIVRVQKKCLYYEVISKKCLLDLEDCRKECINIKGKFQYGDTKEQLINKVAQVMLRKFIANYLTNGTKPKLADEQIQIVYKNYLELAKEIVEFLGVEDAK